MLHSILIMGLTFTSGLALAGGFTNEQGNLLHSGSTDRKASSLINYVDYSGSGCRRGDVEWEEDYDLLFLHYRDFNILARNGRSDVSNCDLYVGLSAPRGYRVGIRAVEMQGEAYVSDQSSTGYIDVAVKGDTARWAQTLTRREQPGYFNDQFRFVDSLADRDVHWSNCGDTRYEVEIQTQLKGETSFSGEVEIAGSRRTGELTQTFEIVLQSCNTPPPGGDQWHGACTVVLETIWGENIREYTGRSCESNYWDAVQVARNDGVRQCEAARGDQNLLRCEVVENDCTATYSSRQ